MKATKQLMEEHNAILVVLSVMEKIKTKLLNDETINPHHIDEIIDFLRTFADKCHHGKEENLLFPAMERAGIPNQGGPIGVMLYEHTLGRNYIQGMTESLAGYKEKEVSSADLLAKNMNGYIALLTAHIQKENNILFAMADQRLSEKEQDALFVQFEKIELEEIGEGKHEEYHQMINRLRNEYKV